MIRISHNLFNSFLHSQSCISNFVVIAQNSLKPTSSGTGAYVYMGCVPKLIPKEVKGMHICLLAVVGFVEEIIGTIHLPTTLYENAL